MKTIDSVSVAPVDEGLPDSTSRLVQLLQESLPRQRCIDRVAEQLADIIEARRRKITWDAIAVALDLNRGTLINAVKTLTGQPASPARRTQPKPLLASFTPSKPASDLPAPTVDAARHYPSKPEDSRSCDDTRGNNVGLTPLGRTKLEHFNF